MIQMVWDDITARCFCGQPTFYRRPFLFGLPVCAKHRSAAVRWSRQQQVRAIAADTAEEYVRASCAPTSWWNLKWATKKIESMQYPGFTKFHILRRDDFTCCDCGKRIDPADMNLCRRMEIDHFHPFFLCRRNDWCNMRAVCVDCHRIKSGYEAWWYLRLFGNGRRFVRRSPYWGIPPWSRMPSVRDVVAVNYSYAESGYARERWEPIDMFGATHGAVDHMLSCKVA